MTLVFGLILATLRTGTLKPTDDDLTLSSRKLLVSYCPHSGYSNQLIELLSAVEIARHMIGDVTLLVPPVHVHKTVGLVGAKDDSCDSILWTPWCERCARETFVRSDSKTWGDLFELQRLSTDRFHLKQIPVGESTMTYAEAYLGGEQPTLIDLCALTSRCGSKVSSTGRQRCGQVIHRLTGEAVSTSARCISTVKSPADSTLWLKFGSIYGLSDTALTPILQGELHLTESVRDIADVVYNMIAVKEGFACAHLRTGYSLWDQPPTNASLNFRKEWTTVTYQAFINWMKNAKFRTVLVLTDDENTVLSVLNAARVTPGKFFFESELFPLHDIDTVSQITAKQFLCSKAEQLFLTPRSTFSRIIGALAKAS